MQLTWSSVRSSAKGLSLGKFSDLLPNRCNGTHVGREAGTRVLLWWSSNELLLIMSWGCKWPARICQSIGMIHMRLYLPHICIENCLFIIERRQKILPFFILTLNVLAVTCRINPNVQLCIHIILKIAWWILGTNNSRSIICDNCLWAFDRHFAWYMD